MSPSADEGRTCGRNSIKSLQDERDMTIKSRIKKKKKKTALEPDSDITDPPRLELRVDVNTEVSF